ncbi:hypothetical protein [Geothrix terrae]|uniref:hypothetical protein n=1 Tax=Geothrix terrae TaxID=2922720 RepID=UPI001FAB8CF6|nr:hypothetical protein [Geothrix terrae]
MTLRPWFYSLILAALALGCGRVSDRQARALVTRYNEVVSEAYRKNDILLIDAVVGPNAPDGRRLTGLIGVHADMGIALDAHLESLEVTSVEQAGGDLRVRTREQWRYRDLRTGTGEQVGEASVDRYEMTYHFRKLKGAWMVEEIAFAAPPQVGRKEVPWTMDAKDAHSIVTPPPGKP